VGRQIKGAAPWKTKESLYEDLRDFSYAAAYVNEALLEGDEVFFKTAGADVVRARSVCKVPILVGVTRFTIFKILKPETRTSFTTYYSLLTAYGTDFATHPIKPHSRFVRK
jgi:DNA-binding phage protein